MFYESKLENYWIYYVVSHRMHEIAILKIIIMKNIKRICSNNSVDTKRVILTKCCENWYAVTMDFL